MQRNLSALILNLDGTPFLQGTTPQALDRALMKFSKENPEAFVRLMEVLKDEQVEPLSVAAAATDALVAAIPGDETTTTLAEKAKRMKTAIKICGGGDVDLSAEEIADIKARVNKRYPGALVPVRVADHLEAEPQLNAVS